MSWPAPCEACEVGNHDGHRRSHGIPGLIGGTYCPCAGDCAEQCDDAAESLLRAIFESRGVPDA